MLSKHIHFNCINAKLFASTFFPVRPDFLLFSFIKLICFFFLLRTCPTYCALLSLFIYFKNWPLFILSSWSSVVRWEEKLMRKHILTVYCFGAWEKLMEIIQIMEKIPLWQVNYSAMVWEGHVYLVKRSLSLNYGLGSHIILLCLSYLNKTWPSLLVCCVYVPDSRFSWLFSGHVKYSPVM